MAMITPTDQTYSYHFNNIGSTIAITDQNQNIVNKYSYNPFGVILNQVEAVSQPFKYVGQYGVMHEPNGFYYMRARYYDPKVGRFVSEDPLGFNGGDVNLYVYAKSNPIMFIDPFGWKWKLINFVASWTPPVIPIPHKNPNKLPNKVECVWECGRDRITTYGTCKPDKARNAYYDGTQFWYDCCCPDPNKDLKEEHCEPGHWCIHSPEPAHGPESPFLPEVPNPTPPGLPPIQGR